MNQSPYVLGWKVAVASACVTQACDIASAYIPVIVIIL